MIGQCISLKLISLKAGSSVWINQFIWNSEFFMNQSEKVSRVWNLPDKHIFLWISKTLVKRYVHCKIASNPIFLSHLLTLSPPFILIFTDYILFTCTQESVDFVDLHIDLYNMQLGLLWWVSIPACYVTDRQFVKKVSHAYVYFINLQYISAFRAS